ncbi:MAG: N-formylglutamate amidohydrolase [Pseudomonadota bacterium]|nr:N-formylglutamate amidohydrolase [Pseudomonadota bacterium]
MTGPILFNSPHSGRIYQKTFLEQSDLTLEQIRASEDCYVDRLIGTAPKYGCFVLEAHFPRVFVDVNRSSEDLDPLLIKNVNLSKTNKRVEAGLGVIPRVVGSGVEIYNKKISRQEVDRRMSTFYFPYHRQLRKALSEIRRLFGYAILLDFHSMPHSSLQLFEKNNTVSPDVVLSDCYGVSCDSWLMELVTQEFVTSGFKVAKNTPFSGGFITRKYGTPQKQIHAIQVEIDRSLYMDEDTYSLKEDYLKLKGKVDQIIKSLSEFDYTGRRKYDAAE